MEEAKTLIRTAVRTFFPHPKQILVIDALMLHSVLHIEDLAVLLSTQPKDIRSFINPLRSARLLATHSRLEARVGSTGRGVQRDYYYCPFHPAIDAVKYRIVKLRRKVEALYQQDETKRKDWRCPRCGSEYEELEILDKMGEEGFYCDRCGATLLQNEQAFQDKGNHEKIRKLNKQLEKFDALIAAVDRKTVPENDFQDAWSRKRDVPRDKGGRSESQYVELKRDVRREGKGPETVKAENLAINLTSGAEQEREDIEKREERRRQLAKQNLLPVWHTSSAIGPGNGPATGAIKAEETNGLAFIPKQEDDDNEDGGEEKKPDLTASSTTTMQDEVALYLADMERERLEAERKAKEEDAEEDEDDNEFEDVVGTSVMGTPASSQQEVKPINGVKRARGRGFDDYDDDEDDDDEESISRPSSSDANTPASFADRADARRVKFEENNNTTTTSNSIDNIKLDTQNRIVVPAAAAATPTIAVKTEEKEKALVGGGEDSDEDEDFEDAI